MKWIQSFQSDIHNKLEAAKQEFAKYKEEEHTIYLQQAGNKLFSAIENYFMVKYRKRVKSYQKLVELVKTDKNDRALLVDAAQLHYFFYNAQLQMENYEAEDIYERVLERFEQVLNNNL